MNKLGEYLDARKVKWTSAFWACVIALVIGIGLGQAWSLIQKRCNEKLIPDGVTCYYKNGGHVERVGE